jgi:hypothetical protein
MVYYNRAHFREAGINAEAIEGLEWIGRDE